MPRPQFFVFSLPRSGSAWLSVFLSGRDSYCYHEPTADRLPAEWVSIAAARPEALVGAVDTGAYRFGATVLEALPSECRLFELTRDAADIGASLRAQRLAIGTGAVMRERERLRSALRDREHPPIEHRQLQDIDYLRELWARVIGTAFDEERARTLIEMRVNRDMRRFLEARPELAAHIRGLTA